MIIDENGLEIPSLYFKLATVNKVLAFFGVQFFIGFGKNAPSIFGIQWVGWRRNSSQSN